jgi:hypothetical protein
MTDIKLAFDTIKGKYQGHTDAFAYYDGDQPIVFASTKLAEIFKSSVKFTENWCSVVVDSVKERIELAGFDVPEGAGEDLEDIWNRNLLDLESDDLHEAALVTGEAYLVVQQSEDGVDMYYNDPRLCHVFYESDNPRKKRMAAKMWAGDDGKYHLTLYYSDRFEKYISQADAENVTDAANFVLQEDGIVPNESAIIPVFHYILSKRVIKGDLNDVIPLQNAINKLLTDMMVVGDYGSFPQRWIISNSDIGKLKNAPNEIWVLPPGDGAGQQTTAGQFAPADLGNYLRSINQLAGDISRITRTPKHYFFSEGGDPSGEALIAMEAPLNRKVQDRIERFEPVWKEAMSYALHLSGHEVDVQDISVRWEKVETVQPRTQAEIRSLGVQAGIPLITLLKDEGWSETQIVDLLKEQKLASAMMADSLLANFEKGQA